jgi:hypothetical protein
MLVLTVGDSSIPRKVDVRYAINSGLKFPLNEPHIPVISLAPSLPGIIMGLYSTH